LIQVLDAIPGKYLATVNLVSFFLFLSIIGIAILLEPSLDGFGTHEGLGLPSCLTARFLNLDRCPSCGLTTAFALIGKGRIINAYHTHPWSVPFFLLLLLFMAANVVSIIRKNYRPLCVPIALAVILGFSYTVCWIVRIAKVWGYA
jgi:hypothetical protein